MTSSDRATGPTTRWIARSDYTLTATPGSTLNEADVLRAFDGLRISLAQLVAPNATSAFIGYDELEFSSVLGAAQRIDVSAVMVAHHKSRHAVEYRAVTANKTAGRHANWDVQGIILARGIGWTLVFEPELTQQVGMPELPRVCAAPAAW